MGNRIEILLQTLELTQAEFCRVTGISKSRLNELLNGRTNNLSADALAAINRYYSVNANWLLTGNGEMFLLPDKDSGISVKNNKGLNIVGNIGDNATINYHPKLISDEEFEFLKKIRKHEQKSEEKNTLKSILKLLKLSLLVFAIYAVYEAVREMPGLEGSEPRAEVQAGGKV